MTPKMQWEFVVQNWVWEKSPKPYSFLINYLKPDENDRLSKCQQPKKPGKCDDNNNKYVTRFYFNSKSKKCEPFSYSGCNGNDNNYQTYQNCVDFCIGKFNI